jgi:hypothetical protein
MTDFKYDVAFSFLSEDEPLARQLANLVSPSATTFVYSECQFEILGTDGVETFSNVFGRDARTVIVLYRPRWGETKWTRIEETAIRTRLLDDGPEFATFVVLEKPAQLPTWYPASRLWLSFDRLGPNGVAAVALERVEHAGRPLRDPTPAEYAQRLDEKRRAEAQRTHFLQSAEGVQAGRTAAQGVFAELERLAPATEIVYERCHPDLVMMYRDGFSVAVEWYCPCVNSLDDSALIAVEWQGRPSLGTTFYAGQERELVRHTFQVEPVEGHDLAWSEKQTSQLRSTHKQAEYLVMLLLKRIEKPRPRSSPSVPSVYSGPHSWTQ